MHTTNLERDRGVFGEAGIDILLVSGHRPKSGRSMTFLSSPPRSSESIRTGRFSHGSSSAQITRIMECIFGKAPPSSDLHIIEELEFAIRLYASGTSSEYYPNAPVETVTSASLG